MAVEGESQTCGTALKYLGLAALSAKIKALEANEAEARRVESSVPFHSF
jgi:hypothetical protein